MAIKRKGPIKDRKGEGNDTLEMMKYWRRGRIREDSNVLIQGKWKTTGTINGADTGTKGQWGMFEG